METWPFFIAPDFLMGYNEKKSYFSVGFEERNGEKMKEQITKWIQDFVKEYEKRPEISSSWGTPLVGFADANHPYILSLKEIIGSSHALPTDVLPDASIVIAYFVPFSKKIEETNHTEGEYASEEWALAYEETNAMFGKINAHIIEKLAEYGIKGGISPETATYDQEKLMSNWSHRHFAKIAGLGTFGINNMLITKKGCCGRYNTIVTNLKVEPDKPLEEELCLYKKNGSCGECVRRCPGGALTFDGYDRQKCNEILMKNGAIYTQFGSSYALDDTGAPGSGGTAVCGKCDTAIPCAYWNLD